MARRGRKRKNGHRQPNGQLARPVEAMLAKQQERDAEIVATAVEARVRVHQVSENEAKHQEAGDWLGRCVIRGYMPMRALRAIRDHYGPLAIEMRRLCGTPPVKSGSDLNRVKGYDASDGTDPKAVEHERRVRARYAECCEVMVAVHIAAKSMVDAALAIEKDENGLGDWLDVITNAGLALADLFGLPEEKHEAA